MRKLRIAQIAPLWIPVPPLTYGGTEFIIHLLTEELIKRGHQVTLFASGDSKSSGKLVPFGKKSLWRGRSKSPHAWYSLMSSEVTRRQNDFDIIHDHTEFYFAPFSKFIQKPIVSTLHRPINYETSLVFKRFSSVHYVFISCDQKNSCEVEGSIIYNAIPVKSYKFNKTPDDYLLWFSKIVPEKGILGAIEVAKRSEEKLIICGNIVPGYEKFFQYEINPLIDGEQIRYIGPADFDKKIEILSDAKALLYPITRREPFGLVVIEAMACGTPVIAFGKGATPELIKHKKTGFITKDINHMLLSIKHISEIDRKICRKHVKEKFNLKKMVDAYEKLYYKILSKP